MICFLYEAGWYHGDVKQENVVLAEDPKDKNKILIKFIDFGFAHPVDLNNQKRIGGTPGFTCITSE